MGSRKRPAPTSLSANQPASSRNNQAVLERLVAELVPSMPLGPLDSRALINAAATSPTRLTARGTLNIDNRTTVKGDGKGQAGGKNDSAEKDAEGGRASPSRAQRDGSSAEQAPGRGSVGGTPQVRQHCPCIGLCMPDLITGPGAYIARGIECITWPCKGLTSAEFLRPWLFRLRVWRCCRTVCCSRTGRLYHAPRLTSR